MPKANSHEMFNCSDWAKIPADILLIILKKLDKKSLFNSMCVNEHWQEVVKYYCKHFNAWRKVVGEATNNSTLTFREKSNLGTKGIVISALRWYNVKNAVIRLNHQYDFVGVRNICIYNGNLIVVTNYGVQYYDICTSLLKKTVDSSSVKCIETSSFLVEFTPSDGGEFGYSTLTVINKLHNRDCNCRQPHKLTFFDINFWRQTIPDLFFKILRKYYTYNFHLLSSCVQDVSISDILVYYRYCYIMDAENVLRRYKVEKCKFHVKVMTDYDCHQDFICGMHIHRKEIYVLMRNGDVFHVDVYGWETGKVCQLDIPLHYLTTKPYMFDTYSAVCAVSSGEKFQIHVQEEEQIVVACPGLTCAKEHGHMLLLGYGDGKIEIFRTSNLRKILETPELQFNLQSYSESLTNKIIAIDVYEDKDCHHVFAATESSVYEFFICDN